jgi:hypothetical protein
MRLLIILLGILGIIIFGSLGFVNQKESLVECEILQGYQSTSYGKSSSQQNFILVVKDNKDRIFDIRVSPSTFYKATINKKMKFTVSEYDITKKRTISEEIYLILFVITLLVTVFSLMFFL